MSIDLIVGPMGSGRTALLTKLAHDEYKKGRIIYANYNVKFPHKRFPEDATRIKKWWDKCIVVDMAYMLFDSRRRAKKSLINLIFLANKHGAPIIIDAKNVRYIDKRIREEYTHLYRPSHLNGLIEIMTRCRHKVDEIKIGDVKNLFDTLEIIKR